MIIRRKLIEVALPLEAINRESAREKAIRHGHPSTLHLWWARRPLAACRAVLFASLVDDPSSDPERFPTPKAQEDERRRLFGLIEELVKWENTSNEAVLGAAREEIRRATGGDPPPVLDPFCGGGSIPLEAQRLGLVAYASDLNPVAVLITKALIEIPPKFAGRPPVHPDARDGLGSSGSWPGASGLAEDIRRYGAWMRDEAERRIGHLYPKVRLPPEQGGGEATVIAWLWARTVRCPNPACGAQMPLVRSFALSTKPGKAAWVEPIVDREAKTVSFEVRTGRGRPPEPPKAGRGASFRCLVCGELAPESHIKAEGQAGRMGAQLMAIVAEGRRGRVYLEPHEEHVPVGLEPVSDGGLEAPMPGNPRWFSPPGYGLTTYRDLFTARQLVALTTFSDLVGEARERVYRHAEEAGLPDDGVPLHAGGTGAPAYADAVAMYLALAVDRVVDRHSTVCTWDSSPSKLQLRNTFARQAIPMTWDFAEGNPFCESSGTWGPSIEWVSKVLLAWRVGPPGSAQQLDAVAAIDRVTGAIVSTDPPYYDNIGYADLSDFFYVWLRRSLGAIYPDLFRTVLTPKAEELVATPYRFGGDARKAEAHFESGLRQAFHRIREAAHPDYPVTIFYAFKQAEEDGDDGNGSIARVSTGWEKMLEGLLDAGFSIHGTWPMRSELGNRMLSLGTNALASSIVLACRPRPADAGVTTRAAFLAALKRELPEALRTLQHGNIAPVDLAQAAIGPGMAVFSRYAKVLEPDGSAMRVRTALALINAVLDEVLAEQEGEFDADTRFAVTWYSQHAFREGRFGDADVLARARDTAVEGLVRAGIVRAGGGKVALLSREELDPAWDPTTDRRPTVWEATQHLVRRLHNGGEEAAADLLARLGGLGDVARDLAYRLYGVAERKGWADEARAYNALVVAWPRLSQLAETRRAVGPAQQALGLGG